MADDEPESENDKIVARVERLIVLKEAEQWCDKQAMDIGAVDGYDYRSGEEYAYRNAAFHFKKAYRILLGSNQ